MDPDFQLSHDPVMQVGHYTHGLYGSLQCNLCNDACAWMQFELTEVSSCFTYERPRTRHGAEVHVISDRTMLWG